MSIERFYEVDTIILMASLVTTLFSIFSLLLSKHSSSEKIRRENKELLSEIQQLKENNNESDSRDKATESSSEDKLKQEKKKIESKDPFDEIVEKLITNHHEQALSQAKIQFWFSLIAACVGFFLIILILFITGDTEWYNKLVMTIPGVIIEVVSALFFSQSKEIRKTSSDFLNHLREDRKFEKGIEIANTLEDDKLKAKMLASISLNLCGISDQILYETSKKLEETENFLQTQRVK